MLNPKRISKADHIWLWENKCKHGHFYREHLNCLIKEDPQKSPLYERIGFVDTETVGLNANWDYIISYAIYDERNDKMFGRVLTRAEVLDYKTLDKKLMFEFCRDVRNFDKIVVYWGKDRRHDIPFLRTRSLKWNAPFPLYREVKVADCYDIVRNKLNMNRRRLEGVCQFLGIEAKGHRLDFNKWQQAKLGHVPSLKYVWEHNKEDVISLCEVFNRLKGFVQKTDTTV